MAKKKSKKQQSRIMLFLGECVFFVAAVSALFQITGRTPDKKAVWKEEQIIADEIKKVPDEEEAELAGTSYEFVAAASETEQISYPEQCYIGDIDKPIKRKTYQVEERLEELAQENEKIADVVNKMDAYPDNLLQALANNPEMADFTLGYLTAEEAEAAELTEVELQQEYPLFLQWDPRWGYVSYGDDSNIGLAGCGPTCMSMVLYYLTGDTSLTPDKIAAYAMEHGYYMSGSGTAWSFMEEVPYQYGVSVSRPGISESRMKRQLDDGNVIICAMRQGDFTAIGHFIVIYGYDEEGFLINDPNCVARSRQSWPFDIIKNQIKQMWAFSVNDSI